MPISNRSGSPPATRADGMMRLRRALYGHARRAVHSDIGLRLAHAGERLRVRAYLGVGAGTGPGRRPRSHAAPRERHVVMLPAGGGNIGDQAMFEAYLANTRGEVVAVMRSADAYVVPDPDEARVRVLRAPLLSAGTLRGRWSEVRALADELCAARSFAVIGADIMDGGYNRAEAVTRAEMLRLAHRLGAPAQVLGFSWGEHVDAAATRAMVRAAREARLFARDPISADRLARAGIATIASADLVFSAGGEQEPADVASWLEHDRDPVVIINLSGLVERRVDIVPEFVGLIDRLTSGATRVLLLPHCLRDGDDDLAVCRRAAAAAAFPHRVLLIERALRPAEVRWLTARARAVITGRMHLSILALSQGTPAVVLRTRGKVEGLARMFGLEAYALEPAPGIGDEIDRALAVLLADAALRERIRETLPQVRELARRPFASSQASEAVPG
ncbi:Polysaccharide pyruvyl transferase [Microbacterium sp. 8M]|uniref:polysaccharide pyruvyl transferase family protein n=1 Tax=Microbacterium sp. 8M TaxID=2653153 RepID=UPI0012F1D19E|nr:polysaccharide pyruvyl transferase family protein [Microbacterium sp. 8M]VXB74423.1 Polysaccharide pyruvyl transferase [Microbacterium sp. 8M]